MPGFDAGFNASSQLSTFTPVNLGSSSTSARGSILGGFNPLDVALSFISDVIGYHRQNKLMDKQYQQSVEQWNRQNEYNSPAAQMARLRAAGLNPDLIYSQMGNGSPAQMMSSEQNVSQHDYGQVLQHSKAQRIAEERLHLDNELAASTISLNESEAEKNRAQARYATSGADWNYRRISSQDIVDDLNRSQIPVNDAQARVLESRVNEIAANIDLLVSKKEYQDVLTAIANIDKAFKTDWWRAEIRLLQSEAHVNDMECQKLEQSIMEMKSSWELRFKNMQHDERINYSKEVMAMATAAVNRWKYTLDEDGNPQVSKGAAAYNALDMAVSLIGKIFHVGVSASSFEGSTQSSNINQNDFYNHSSWSEKRGKGYKVHTGL